MFFFFQQNPKYNFVGGYAALDVAQYIIRKCSLDRKPISDLQLQKILYYIQKYFIQVEKRALFSDEIEAWQFGPVVRSVYTRYCGYGAVEIFDTTAPDIELSVDERTAIDQIVEEKRIVKPWELVNDTHAKGKAWDIIYRDGAGDKDIIPKDVIAEHG